MLYIKQREGNRKYEKSVTHKTLIKSIGSKEILWTQVASEKDVQLRVLLHLYVSLVSLV